MTPFKAATALTTLSCLKYDYHGLPTGLIENVGANEANKKMILVGWVGDGYPVYGRDCHSDAMDANSPLKVCNGDRQLSILQPLPERKD